MGNAVITRTEYAERGQSVLHSYRVKHESYDRRPPESGDYAVAACDLLADLMHWANRDGYDFDALVSTARMHFEAETGGEDGNG